MRNQSFYALGAAMFLTAFPAAAADWSGFYGGLHVGYAAGRDAVREVNGDRAYYPDTSGVVLGAQVGWLRQMNRVVAGVEFEVGSLGQSGDVTRADGFGTVKSSADYGAYGTLSGRLGYVLSQEWLVFGRLGLTLAGVDAKTEQSCSAGGCALAPSSASTRDHAWGVAFGGGAERELAQDWTGRMEYQYVDFRNELAIPESGSGPGWKHDADLHAIKFSLNRRF